MVRSIIMAPCALLRRLWLCSNMLLVIWSTVCCAGAMADVSNSTALSQLYDAGTVRVGVPVRHTFCINNAGTKSLRVVDKKLSCSCSVLADGGVNEIPSGGSGRFELVLATDGKEGPFEQSAYIECDNGQVFALTIKGVGQLVCPKTISLGSLKRGAPCTKQFELHPLPNSPFLIDRISSDERRVLVRQVLNSGGNPTFELELRLDIPYGPLRTAIVIQTTDTVESTKVVSVLGYVERAVETDPSRLLLVPSERNDEWRGSLRLYSPYGKGIRLNNAANAVQTGLDIRVTDAKQSELQVEVLIERELAKSFALPGARNFIKLPILADNKMADVVVPVTLADRVNPESLPAR